MALITPILEKHDAFDATKKTTFKITVGGGGETFSRINITVKNNVSGITVCDKYWSVPSQSGAGVYTENYLPAYNWGIVNGGYYTAYVQTWNETTGYSSKSNSIQFYCLADPTLTRSDYSEGEEVTESYKKFTTIYDQASDEPLDVIHHVITNVTTGEIYKDETMYAGSTTVPYTIVYQVAGLLKECDYTYDIDIKTVNGLTTSLSTNFSVDYEIPSYESLIKLSNLCDYGVIRVESKFKSISGQGRHFSYATDSGDKYALLEKSTTPMDYEVHNNVPRVWWNKSSFEGIEVNQNNMTLMMWFKPETPNSSYWSNLYFQSGNQEGTGSSKYNHRLDFRRGKIPNSNNFGDYIQYRVYDNINKQNIIDMRSNYVTDLGTSDDVYYVYFNRNENTVDLRLEKLTDRGDSALSWNDENNTGDSEHMYLNKLDNLIMIGQSSVAPAFTPLTADLPNEREVNGLYLYNGGFYHLTIYSGQQEYNTTKPTEWTEDMQFNCSFDDNLNAGNFDVGADVDTIFIKKRLVDSNKWLPLYHVAKDSASFSFNVYDPYCINGLEYVYAIVPCKKVNNSYIEGNYIIGHITSTFDGFIIADKNNLFKSMINVNYDATDTAEYGLVQPLNKKYPVIIHNGITRYNTGSLNCAIMGYKYMSTRQLNTKDIAKMRNDVIDFLNDGETKIVKAWTGDIVVIEKIGDVTRNINSQTGYSSIGFSWVEQGHIDDPEIYERGLLQAIDHVPDFMTQAGYIEDPEDGE
jgi:hypothetical protein